MAGSPYVPDAKKYHPGDLQRVPGEPADPDPSSWGMQPDGTFLPPALTPSVPRDIFVDWEGQLPEFDRNTYLVNTEQVGFWPYVTNTSHSWQHIYEMDGVRYMLHYGGGNRWNVYDITDPRDLKLVDEETLPWSGPGFGAVTIAWNERLGKRIAIQANETPRYFLKGRVANKHIDPTVEPQLLEWEGLRGFRVFEVKGPTPRDWELLTEVSTDPNHGPGEIQEGNGVLDLPVYYGGDYLFVASAPDNTFTNQPYKTTLWTAGHIAYDVSDPTNPRRLSTWWVDGSRKGEEASSPYLADNPRWDNKTSWFGSRMGLFLPRSVESGWKYGYAAQGGQGFFVLDISDPANMRQVGWCPLPESVAGTEGDNVDTTQVEATGYVYVSGYPMNTDCSTRSTSPTPRCPGSPARCRGRCPRRRLPSRTTRSGAARSAPSGRATSSTPARPTAGSSPTRSTRAGSRSSTCATRRIPRWVPSSCPRWASRSTTTWRRPSTASSWSGTATSSGCSPTTASTPCPRRSWARS
jgi:hypothetical protein